MKTSDWAKKGLYVGTGAGIVLFALVGLLPGSFIGGLIGMTIAKWIFGAELLGAVLPRLVVAVGMVAGVVGAAIVFVLGGGMLGYAGGFIAEAITSNRKQAAATTYKV